MPKTTTKEKPTLGIFLKAPRRGEVKTRLAKTIGDSKALSAYRQLVERQMAILPSGWDTRIHYTPTNALQGMQSWLGSSYPYQAQSEGNLGQRLSQAVSLHFKNHATPLLLIGADCPWLDSPTLESAADALEHADVVLGPAHDGGYYLIGLNSNQPSLFDAIDWSTESVFLQTLERASKAGLSVFLLDPKHDVDSREEWELALSNFPELAPHELEYNLP